MEGISSKSPLLPWKLQLSLKKKGGGGGGSMEIFYNCT